MSGHDQRKCPVEGCEKLLKGRTLCVMHYKRKMRSGDTGEAAPRITRYETMDEKFIGLTERRGECVEWLGAKKTSGYGMIYLGDQKIAAHRYAWERANGPIPDGGVIDHKCFNPPCVNVEHLRVATVAQNCQNKEGPAKASRSGVRNVHWDGKAGKWFVRMEVNKKVLWGGYFTDVDEAEKAAIKMRRKVMPWSIR